MAATSHGTAANAEIAMIQTASTGMRLAVLKNVTQAVYQFRGVEPVRAPPHRHPLARSCSAVFALYADA